MRFRGQREGGRQGTFDRREFLQTALVAGGTVTGVGAVYGGEKEQSSTIVDWDGLDAIRGAAGEYTLEGDLTPSTDGYDTYVEEPTGGWEPIGSADLPFEGSLQGNGHEISGLRIDRPDQDTVGLFGVSEGTIRNVSLVDCDVTGANSVGGLVGRNDGEVSNSFAGGTISGENRVGGLLGASSESVTASYATCTVTGADEVGGLIGYSTSSVADSAAGDQIEGNETVGGLIGNSAGAVNNSLATGEVAGQEAVGGLAGRTTGEVTNSFTRSAVSGNSQVGGLAGDNAGAVSTSFACGAVDGEEDVGGLLGRTDTDTTVSDSYWDVEATTQDDGIGVNDGEVTGFETDEMQGETAELNLAELDFVNQWVIRTTPPDYPALQWQDTRFVLGPLKTPDQTRPGEEFEVRVGITLQSSFSGALSNTNFPAGRTVVHLGGPGGVERQKPVEVAPGETKTVTFTVTAPNEVDTYEYSISESGTKRFIPISVGTDTGDAGDDSDDADGNGAGFGSAVAGLGGLGYLLQREWSSADP